MAEDEQSSRFIAAVFAAWQQANIPFLILRNYEELPGHTTNDIDALVPKDRRAEAEKVLVGTGKANGFRLHNRAPFATLALYFSNAETGAQVHFDLFTDLKWRGFDFLEAQDFLAKRVARDSFFVPHPAHEACVNLLASFIFNGTVKEKYRAKISEMFKVEGETARVLMAKSYGEALAAEFLQCGAGGNWKAIESKLSAARKELVVRQVKHKPGRTFMSLDADCDRLLARAIWPPGLVVVLCGPDGCGKSTIAPMLVEALRGSFSPQKGRQLHWKPRVFSRSRETGAPETNPHGKPVRNTAASLAYFGFHWLEFFLGWWLRIFPAIFRGGLVLIDRYYFDFFVDQKRYRLRVPPGLVTFGYALLPKPDLVFLLDAPVEVLRQRKQEVPPEETARQREAFVEMMKRVKHGVIIDATRSPEEITERIEKAVLDFMARRTTKRHG